MRRRWLVLLAALLAVVLAACGGQGQTETDAGDAAGTRPVVTVFKPPS